MRCFGRQVRDLEQVPTPVGEACAWCAELILAGEAGILRPCVGLARVEEKPWHEECHARNVLGSVGHQKRLCSCYGGTQEDDPALSVREAAHAALEYARRAGIKDAVAAGRVSMAESAGVEQLEAIGTEFMRKIFSLEPEDYAITDESDIRDFVPFTSERPREIAATKARIAADYALKDVPTNLLAIFRLLAQRGHVH